MAAEAPVGNGLIVDIGLRLGQKGLEILTDTQLFRTGAGVIRTAAAPQIELVAGIVQAADMGDDGGHGDAGLADAAHQRVIDIYEYGFGAGWVHDEAT